MDGKTVTTPGYDFILQGPEFRAGGKQVPAVFNLGGRLRDARDDAKSLRGSLSGSPNRVVDGWHVVVLEGREIDIAVPLDVYTVVVPRRFCDSGAVEAVVSMGGVCFESPRSL